VDAEQEILMLLADIAIEIYAMDTAFHRTRKIVEGGANREIHIAMFRTFVNDAVSRIQVSARQIAAATGSERSALHLSWQPIDTVSTRRRIAEFVLESN
jgi:hypothetical protein